MNFNLSAPCGDCPFKREGAIDLMPGRVQGIIDHLLSDDYNTFPCHKTVHCKRGGEWDDEGNYTPSGNESACAGSMIFLLVRGRPSVMMRIGIIHGSINVDALLAQAPSIISGEAANGKR